MMKSALLISLLFVFLIVSITPLQAEDYYAGEAPWLGLTIREGAGGGGGYSAVVVEDVIEGGPAWDAGVTRGDVILEIDGSGVRSTGEFVNRVRSFWAGGAGGAGTAVHLVVERDGQKRDLYVNLSGGSRAYPWTSYPRYGTPYGPSYGPSYAPPGSPYGYYPTYLYGMKDDGVYATMYFRAMTLLDLRGEQRAEVAALMNRYEKGTIRLSGEIQILEVELGGLLIEDPVDLKKVRARVDEMARVEGELRFLRITSYEELKGILTPEQRMRLQAMMPFADAPFFYGR